MQCNADIILAVNEFCVVRGLSYHYYESCGFFKIGNSGFNLKDAGNINELNRVLEECWTEHNKIESVKWKSGLLVSAMQKINDDPTRAALEDRIVEMLSDPAGRVILDKLAKILVKYAKLY